MGQEPLSRADEPEGHRAARWRPSWDEINDRAQAWVDSQRTALQIRAASRWALPEEAVHAEQLDFAHEASKAAVQIRAT